MSNEHGGHTPGTAQSRFDAGVEDLIIFPLVAIALVVKQLLHAMLRILIHILDYAFPILLQLARFPLFTIRIVGDAIVALLKGIVRFLPMSGTKREAWRELVSRYWSWLRQKISYKAFEEAVHHAFEGGMAWVFRKCRTLTPRGALLVIVGAVLWLPISFGLATAMHAVLLAEAASLPAWMQLLHPLATVIAKTKLWSCRHIRRPGRRRKNIRSSRRCSGSIAMSLVSISCENRISLPADRACGCGRGRCPKGRCRIGRT